MSDYTVRITPLQWEKQNKDRVEKLRVVMNAYAAAFNGRGYEVHFHLPYRKNHMYIAMGIRPKKSANDFLFYFGFFYEDIFRAPAGYIPYAAKLAIARYKKFQNGTLGVEILSDESVFRNLEFMDKHDPAFLDKYNQRHSEDPLS